jgi:heme-degrading monooxygenase HmoA
MAFELDDIRTESPKPWVRMTTFEGSCELVQRAMNLALEHVVPASRSQPGWQGTLGLMSFDGKRGITVSFWDTADAFQGTGYVVKEFRRRATEAGLDVSESDRLEIVFDERVQ